MIQVNEWAWFWVSVAICMCAFAGCEIQTIRVNAELKKVYIAHGYIEDNWGRWKKP